MANKTYDLLLELAKDVAVTSTASTTGVNIKGLNIGSASYVAVISNRAVTGTVDASNYYYCVLEVSDTVGGTYVPVGNSVVFPATAGSTQVGFTSEQINDRVSGANFFRITVAKIGTTATGVSVSAFLSKI